MKLKLAIIFGILIWVISYFLTGVVNPLFTDNLPRINIIVPLTLIITTGFFGILYIRNIEKNEVVEGFMAGVIFIIIDVFMDIVFMVISNHKYLIYSNYTLHFLSTVIITLSITTFLGYLAQMNIDLK